MDIKLSVIHIPSTTTKKIQVYIRLEAGTQEETDSALQNFVNYLSDK